MSARRPFFPRLMRFLMSLIAAVIILAAVFTGAVYIIHINMLKTEKETLADAGYINPVSVGDYSLNVTVLGNPEGKHTLVGLAGYGVHDYSSLLRPVTDRFCEENQVVFVDRAGYGLSDDTKVLQDIERIVSDYRKALAGAGIEPPYVLLPHSLSGAYATYWESVYPDEIEGIVFFDGTELSSDEKVFGDDYYSGTLEEIEVYLCKVGFQRIVYSDFYVIHAPSSFPERYNKISYALSVGKFWTNAIVSESNEMNNTVKKAFDSIVANDIPKVYVNAKGFSSVEDVRDLVKYVNACEYDRGKKEPYSFDSEEEFLEFAEWLLEETKKMNETVTFPYLEKLGNCEVVDMPGDHYIFLQKPDECAEVVEKLLCRIDGAEEPDAVSEND